jgi:integrin beta 3
MFRAALGDLAVKFAELSADVRGRVAALEARPAVPGPAGVDGAPGAAGQDGADGLTFGDLVIEQLSEREVLVKAIAGERVKELGRLVFPVVLDAGTYTAGRLYEKGDAVSYDGSLWIARQATTARPATADGAAGWRLAVKRGGR